MSDIRVVVTVEEEPSGSETASSVWDTPCMVDAKIPISPDLLGFALCDFNLQWLGMLEVTPEILELSVKKLIVDSWRINAYLWSFSRLPPMNFILPIIRTVYTVRGARVEPHGGAYPRRFFRKKTTTITHEEKIRSAEEGLSSAFDQICRAVDTTGKLIMLATHEECNVVGLLLTPVRASNPDCAPCYGQVGYRADYDTVARCETWLVTDKEHVRSTVELCQANVHSWLKNIIRVWHFSRSIAARLVSVCNQRVVFAPVVSLDWANQPIVPIKSISLSKLPAYRFSRLADVQNQRLTMLLYLEEVFGPDDPRVVAIVTNYLSAVNRQTWQQAKKARYALALQEETALRKIICDLFGMERMAKLENSSKSHEGKWLSLLTPQERQMVNMEKKKLDERLNADPKCPHRRALRMLDRASGPREILAAVDAVKKFAVDNKGSRNARLPPMMLYCSNCKGRLCCPHTLIREEMMARSAKQDDIRAALQPYTMRYSKRFLCTVCGEVLTQDDFTDPSEAYKTSDLQDEEIRGRIIVEVYGLLRFLKFKIVVNARAFVYAVCDAIYSTVQDTERQIDKSRMSTTEESDAKSKVFIVIYAMAYFLVLIMRKGSIVQFRSSSVKTDPATLVLTAVNFVLLSKNILINRIKGLSSNVIKAKMIDAYKVLISAKFDEKTVTTVAAERFNLACDPIYRTLVRTWYLSTRSKKYDLSFNATNVHLAKEVLSLPTSHVTYDHVRAVKLPDSEYSRAYRFLLELVQLKPHWLYDNVGSGTTIISRRSAFFDGILARKEELEAAVYKARQWKDIRRAVHCGSYPLGERSYLRAQRLGYTYDVKGRLHQWKFETCTVCGATKKDAVEVPEKEILETIRRNDKYTDLFLYFENRCPEATRHNMVGEPPCCSLCKLHAITNDEYYAKYVGVFDEERTVHLAPLVEPPPWVEAHPLQFTFDFSKVIEFCKKTGANRYVIMALGASGGVTNAEILEGSYIPAEIFEKTNPRVFILSSYIRTTLCIYNQVRRYFSIQKPPEDIVKLVQNAHITEEVARLMPVIPNDYATHARQVMQMKPRQIVEFALDYFCELCGRIWDISRVTGQLILAKVFRAEVLASKHGSFNKSLVFGFSDVKETNLDEEEGESEFTADGVSADQETKDDPFGVESFDVEEDPGSLEEDEGVKLHFGDESGVD